MAYNGRIVCGGNNQCISAAYATWRRNKHGGINGGVAKQIFKRRRMSVSGIWQQRSVNGIAGGVAAA